MKLLIFYFLITNATLCSAQNFNASEMDANEKKKVISVVNQWSQAHDDWDLKLLKSIYADTLLFYCQVLSKGKCLSKISSMLNPNKTFKHRISSAITLTALQGRKIKCDFTKEVITDNGADEYSSYLVVENINNRYVVVAESDYLTDKNLHYNFSTDFNKTKLTKAASLPTIQSVSFSSFIVPTGVGILLIAIILLVLNKHSKSKKLLFDQNAELSPTPLSEILKEKTPTAEQLTSINLSVDELNKKKGDEFENYVLKKFDRKYFNLKDWRSDKKSDGRFPESNKFPDFEFEFSLTSYKNNFAVECKYRSNYNSGYLEIAKAEQLANYREFEKEKRMDVYLVVGVGGEPSLPDEIFLINLKFINSAKIHNKELAKYQKKRDSSFFYARDIQSLT